MRILANPILVSFWTKHPDSKEPLIQWREEVEIAKWTNMNDLKEQYRNASVITGKRVVFNIKGNSYRLIIEIEFRLNRTYILWLGTHKEYDRIDAKTVNYVKPK